MLDFELSTLIFQTINFLVLLTVLAWFFYKPLLRVMRQREEAIARELDSARQSEVQAEQERQQLSREREDFHTRAETIIADARAEASRLKEQITTDAQQQAEGIVEQASRRAQEQLRVAGMQLQEQARGTAIHLAGEVIRQNAGPYVHQALLDEFLKPPASGGAPADWALPAMRHALMADHPELMVELAYPPTEGLEDRIRAALAAAFGVSPGDISMSLHEEPSLLAGLRLVAGKMAVDFSLRGTLEQLRQGQGSHGG